MIVELRDTSEPEGRGVVAEQRFDLRGRQVPIPFEVTVDFARLDPARLTVGQTEYEMRQTRTASGARFEAVNDPATWFWNRGRAGRLSLAGREYPECRQVETTPSILPGNEWVVESIDGGGIIDRSRATLVFGTDGQIAGRGSCNTYTGRYEATGDAIRIVGVASTSRACAPALVDQETRFHAALRDARRFQIRADGALVLHTDDRRSVLARRDTPR